VWLKSAQIRAQLGKWRWSIGQQRVCVGEAQAIEPPDWHTERSPFHLLLAELEDRDFESMQSRVQDSQVLTFAFVAGVHVSPRHGCCDGTPDQARSVWQSAKKRFL
jgi:hypothetical protein